MVSDIIYFVTFVVQIMDEMVSHHVSETNPRAKNKKLALALTVAHGKIHTLQHEEVGSKDQLVDVETKLQDLLNEITRLRREPSISKRDGRQPESLWRESILC